jgi:hypothetical protein
MKPETVLKLAAALALPAHVLIQIAEARVLCFRMKKLESPLPRCKAERGFRGDNNCHLSVRILARFLQKAAIKVNLVASVVIGSSPVMGAVIVQSTNI